jgi:putative membrane protein
MWNDWVDHGMNGWMWAAMIVAVLAVWALVGLAVRSLVHGGSNGPVLPPSGGGDSLRLLAERLAQGEITVEQYERIKEALTRTQ